MFNDRRTRFGNTPALISRVATLAATAALTAMSGCDVLDSIAGSSCPTFAAGYDQELQSSGLLVETIPAQPENFPMGLVLNTRAINWLFARLADTELPEISESFGVLGQDITLIVQPEIPLLAIGGNARCPACLSAAVPLSIGVGINNPDPPRGSGQLMLQMPVSMVPVDNRKTSLVAQFQGLEITGIDIDLPVQVPNTILQPAEDLAADLLDDYLSSRFRDAKIATFDSWELGQGQILLAGRGPFVYPESGTMLVAMQSNLPLAGTTTLDVLTTLPEGADMGFVFHPGLLLALSRRMNFEGVVPSEVDDAGNSFDGASEGPANRVTLQAMETTEEGLLRTSARIWRTDSFCGTADLQASMGLSIGDNGFAFTVQDVEITGGQGFGSLLGNSWAGGELLNSLLSTLDITVNYDQIFGGERAEQAEMGTFQANIDARGISVYLNIIDGV
jgi:hypothetical protein